MFIPRRAWPARFMNAPDHDRAGAAAWSVHGVSTPDLAARDGLEAVEHVAGGEHRIALGHRLVARDHPRVLLRAEAHQRLLDRGAGAQVERGARRAVGEKAPERAVHDDRDRHSPAALTRGMTSRWKRSMTISMRPSGDTG